MGGETLGMRDRKVLLLLLGTIPSLKALKMRARTRPNRLPILLEEKSLDAIRPRALNGRHRAKRQLNIPNTNILTKLHHRIIRKAIPANETRGSIMIDIVMVKIV